MDQDREFFEKKLRWVKRWQEDEGCNAEHDGPEWEDVNGRQHCFLPNVSGCWNAFRKWVIPELVNGAKTAVYLEHIERIVGVLYCSLEHKTPANALAWAMEMIPDEKENLL